MVSVAAYIDILKQYQLWISDQSIKMTDTISGSPETDSRRVKAGDAFICIKGLQSDGHNYISKARDSGAVLIIQSDEYNDTLPAIRVKDTRKAAALLAKLYFDNPTSKFTLIGITGTNGKTTTSMLIRQALSSSGFKTGWIGTLGYQIESDMIETNNTTPDILELNNIFVSMVNAGCKYVVMEVSSHALALDRVFGLEFDVALFTNLSHEHLDFHKDMSTYFESKYLLFDYVMLNGGTAILNVDDEYGRIISSRLKKSGYVNQITVSEISGDLVISKSICSINGCMFELSEESQTPFSVKIKLIGHFNILNSAMALVAIKVLLPSIGNNELQSLANQFSPIKGRLEFVQNNRKIGIYVDYAHTPDALNNVLRSLNELPHKRIITVFGAGGDRDQSKRPEMLKYALEISNAVIITDDNPRTENPSQIIKDIVSDANLWKPWWVLSNREEAIHSSIRLATESDIVLIAGKGHETYQEVNGIRSYFNDTECATNFVENVQELVEDELVLPIDPILLELIFKGKFTSKQTGLGYFRFVSTDSRTIKAASLFFALRGELYDGNDYVKSVLHDDTNAVVIDDKKNIQSGSIFYHDSQLAMGLLARKYLLMFSTLKIALTGSTGKTTTKEFMANIFSMQGQTLKTLANENNLIGLCKTIFRIKPEDQTAIFELGSNHFGEINTLADVCNPDIAMITNIGPSHLEFFGDEEGVYREKTDLFKRELDTIIYPGDDDRFDEFSSTGKGVGYNSSCFYKIHDVVFTDSKIIFRLNEHEWEIHQAVPQYLTNAAFAIAIALEVGLSTSSIQLGLNKNIDLSMRMEIMNKGNRIVIADCYNANPVSMRAAIEYWHSVKQDRPHVAILGDMLEMGSKSVDYHENIGNQLHLAGYDLLFTVGEYSILYQPKEFQKNNSENKVIKHFTNIDELMENTVWSLIPNDAIVLVKASHGIHLDKVLEFL